MTKHYHVLGGLRGYVPNVNYTCETKAEARAILSDCKKLEIEYSYFTETYEQADGFGITGSIKSGRYDLTLGGNEYYSIVTCQEPDCLLFLDE